MSGRNVGDGIPIRFRCLAACGLSCFNSIDKGSGPARIFGVFQKSRHRSFHSGGKITGYERRGIREDSGGLYEPPGPIFRSGGFVKIRGSYENVVRICRIVRENAERAGKGPTRNERYAKTFGIETQFRVIGIACRIIRSRRAVRTGDEKRRDSIENDDRSARQRVCGIVFDEFPRRTIARRSIRGNCRKYRPHVRHRFRVASGRVILRKRNQSNNRKNRKNGYYDEELGESESEMGETLRSNHSCRNNAAFHMKY